MEAVIGNAILESQAPSNNVNKYKENHPSKSYKNFNIGKEYNKYNKIKYNKK